MATCEWCGGEVAPQKVKRGTGKKYCSDRCRKSASAERNRGACMDCGGPMAVGSAWRSKASKYPRERCMACHHKREAAACQARLEDVAAAYREGMSTSEIAVMLGYQSTSRPPEITAAFKAGLLTEADYRYDATRRENMRRKRWAA